MESASGSGSGDPDHAGHDDPEDKREDHNVDEPSTSTADRQRRPPLLKAQVDLVPLTKEEMEQFGVSPALLSTKRTDSQAVDPSSSVQEVNDDAEQGDDDEDDGHYECEDDTELHSPPPLDKIDEMEVDEEEEEDEDYEKVEGEGEDYEEVEGEEGYEEVEGEEAYEEVEGEEAYEEVEGEEEEVGKNELEEEEDNELVEGAADNELEEGEDANEDEDIEDDNQANTEDNQNEQEENESTAETNENVDDGMYRRLRVRTRPATITRLDPRPPPTRSKPPTMPRRILLRNRNLLNPPVPSPSTSSRSHSSDREERDSRDDRKNPRELFTDESDADDENDSLLDGDSTDDEADGTSDSPETSKRLKLSNEERTERRIRRMQLNKPFIPKGRGRRSIYKRAAGLKPIRGIMESAAPLTCESLFYDGKYFQKGDIVSVRSGEGLVYFCQIVNLMRSEKFEAVAAAAWLTPKEGRPAYPFVPQNYSKPSGVQTLTANLEHFSFVMHCPDDYFEGHLSYFHPRPGLIYMRLGDPMVITETVIRRAPEEKDKEDKDNVENETDDSKMETKYAYDDKEMESSSDTKIELKSQNIESTDDYDDAKAEDVCLPSADGSDSVSDSDSSLNQDPIVEPKPEVEALDDELNACVDADT